MKIITEYVAPPIPVTKFDWRAAAQDYEPGDPIGYGATEEEAKENLNVLFTLRPRTFDNYGNKIK
jgi:hypothetical protein